MSREIETDGFITRAEDLTPKERKKFLEVWEESNEMFRLANNIDWDAQAVQVDKLVPPPFGDVIITEQGLVLMCKGTYKMLAEGKEYEEVEL